MYEDYRVKLAWWFARRWHRHIWTHDCLPELAYATPTRTGCFYERNVWRLARWIHPYPQMTKGVPYR